MRVAVIINPVSGARSRRAAAHVRSDLADRVLRHLDVTPDIRVTEHGGHATVLARDALERGANVVCSWGGDGTLNEVARATAFTGVPFAIVPSGSGNGLARELRTPSDPTRALQLAVSGTDRKLDAGEINGRLFVNVAGVGLDAVIAHRFAGHARRGFGPYLAIAARELWTYRPATYDLTIDGRPTRARALMIVAANSRQYGNGAIIAPAAKPDDGELDLVIVDGGTLLGTLSRVPRLFRGTLDSCAAVSMQRARAITIRAAGPLLAHIDGEPLAMDGDVSIEVKPAALMVRC
jgi:YegS/Rv2252/BmrU family lipid kinase